MWWVPSYKVFTSVGRYSEIKRICKLTTSHPPVHNLTPQERSPLNSLINNTTIIIKPSEKGGGIVIQDRDTYLSEAHSILSEKKHLYLPPSDPLSQFCAEAQTLVKQALSDGIINKAEAFFLSREYYHTPCFYHLPKIHKDLENPPGPPTVAAMESITRFFSIYIDHFL